MCCMCARGGFWESIASDGSSFIKLLGCRDYRLAAGVGVRGCPMYFMTTIGTSLLSQMEIWSYPPPPMHCNKLILPVSSSLNHQTDNVG